MDLDVRMKFKPRLGINLSCYSWLHVVQKHLEMKLKLGSIENNIFFLLFCLPPGFLPVVGQTER